MPITQFALRFSVVVVIVDVGDFRRDLSLALDLERDWDRDRVRGGKVRPVRDWDWDWRVFCCLRRWRRAGEGRTG